MPGMVVGQLRSFRAALIGPPLIPRSGVGECNVWEPIQYRTLLKGSYELYQERQDVYQTTYVCMMTDVFLYRFGYNKTDLSTWNDKKGL